MMSESIANRAIGGFPISVATSLAIESACGIHPEIPVDRAPILDYQECWVNMRTLFRNFLGALDPNAVKGVLTEEIAEEITIEMDAIDRAIGSYSDGKTRTIYYVSDYAGLEKYKLGVVRRDNTPKQKHYTALLNNFLAFMLQHHKDIIRTYPLKLKPTNRPSALILTHYPFDLFSASNFSNLVLLESHTGAIKERAQWYTKYFNGKELSMIPFREDFIQVFGDKETFRPGDPHLRDDLIEIATKYKWTAVTQRDKLIYGIDQLKNPFFREKLKSILV